MYILRVTDFETTGIPNDDEEHSVIESAFVDVCAETKNILGSTQSLVIPFTEMSIEALATHHISLKEASEIGVSWKVAYDFLADTGGNTIVYVAHNADFEKQFFNPEGSLWIDTYKVALVLYPDAPGHGNQVLKYFLGIENKAEHHPPHRALPDCLVTAEILLKMAEHKTFNEMIHISKQVPYLTKINFGKHRGEKFENLPKDYLQWLSSQRDMDAAVIAAAKRYL